MITRFESLFTSGRSLSVPSTTTAMMATNNNSSALLSFRDGSNSGNYTDMDVLPISIERELTKPKRPLSAYNFFYKIERAKLLGLNVNETIEEERMGLNSRPVKRSRKHRKTPGMIGFKELAQKVSSKWRSMSQEERKPYQDMFEEDRERYQREMMAWSTCQPIRDEWRFKPTPEARLSLSLSSSTNIAGSKTKRSNNGSHVSLDPKKPTARKTYSASSTSDRGGLSRSQTSVVDDPRRIFAESRKKSHSATDVSNEGLLRHMCFDLMSSPSAIAECKNMSSYASGNNRSLSTMHRLRTGYFNDEVSMKKQDPYIGLKSTTSWPSSDFGQQNQPWMPQLVTNQNQKSVSVEDDFFKPSAVLSSAQNNPTQMSLMANQNISQNNTTSTASIANQVMGEKTTQESRQCSGDCNANNKNNWSRLFFENDIKKIGEHAKQKRRESASICISFFNEDDDLSDMQPCSFFPEEQVQSNEKVQDETFGDGDMLDLENDLLASLCEDEGPTNARSTKKF